MGFLRGDLEVSACQRGDFGFVSDIKLEKYSLSL